MRSQKGCTSCHDGQFLSISYHKDKAGACRHFKTTAELTCTDLDVNSYGVDPGNNNILCVKGVLSRTELAVRAFANETIRNHFWPTTRTRGVATAYCAVYKQTACRTANYVMSCKVRKEVKCVKVCKGSDEGCQGDISESACDGEFGPIACKKAALME